MILLDGYEGLGTKFWVEVFDDVSSEQLSRIKNRVKSEIDEFGSKYSRFNSDSILSRLNSERRLIINSLSGSDLINMLKLGIQYGKSTAGIFDIFIKERLENIGYGKANTNINNNLSKDGNLNSDLEFTIDCDNTSIDIIGSRGIDLGGIGKGYLIDKISNIIINEYNIKYFIVNGGGDMYVSSNHEESVELYLEHPIEAGEYIYKIKIKNQSLCVSSSFKRAWQNAGAEVNHFITKEGEAVWAAAYIVGPSATLSDVAATVACISSDNTESLSKNMEALGVQYLVIDKNGKAIKSDAFPELLE